MNQNINLKNKTDFLLSTETILKDFVHLLNKQYLNCTVTSFHDEVSSNGIVLHLVTWSVSSNRN